MTGVSSMAQQINPGVEAALTAQSAAFGGRFTGNQRSVNTGALISGSLGTVSALGAIGSGFAQRASLQTEAYNMDYQAKAAQLEGQRQALLALDDFSRSQARAVAAIGASGIGYDGSPVGALDESERSAKSDRDLMKAGTRVQVAGYKAQAKQLRKSARLAPLFGFLKAGEQVGSMFMGGRGGF